jgi:hypothetical protein
MALMSFSKVAAEALSRTVSSGDRWAETESRLAQRSTATRRRTEEKAAIVVELVSFADELFLDFSLSLCRR